MNFPRLILIYISSLIFAASLFSFFEDKPFRDAFYWACMTATTIGYGDLSPSKPETRAITIICAHFWVFYCIPYVVALILGNIIRDDHKFTHEEQEWQEEALQKLADKLEVTLPPRK